MQRLTPAKFRTLFVQCVSVAFCLATIGSGGQQLRQQQVGAAAVHIEVNHQTGDISLAWKDGSLIKGIYSRVVLVDGRVFATTDYSIHKIIRNPSGDSMLIRHMGPGLPTLTQHVWFIKGKPWVEIQAEMDGAAAAIGTRHFSPIMFDGPAPLSLNQGKALRVLHVPYDNDMWFRFDSVALGHGEQEVSSNEVTTIYDNDLRKAFVFGSVVHDTWKSSIDVHARNGTVTSVEVYGGLHGTLGERSDTHDFVEHGIVKGSKVLSPRVMVGEFSDWRDGLEAYGRRNAVFQPPLKWSGPRPMGWNSWAAYADKINHQRYIAAANFVHDELMPEGFRRSHVYVNFDAFWSNLDGVALVDAARTVDSLSRVDGAKVEPGIYWTPFAAWTDNLDGYVEGTNGKYRYRDILLKGPDGKPLPKVDGGRPIDPTHPGTRMRTKFYIDALAKMGFKYLKIDFLSHGALEGMHYDPSIQTGTEAYNEGMRDVIKANAGRMFISLSIAPLFPSGYGHARRLSCDTKGHINGQDQSTEYMLNALTYAWWTDGSLYIIDPDHVVLGEKADQGARTLDEARSRLLSAIVSGGMILDSSRLADDPVGQALAKQVYGIRSWMDVAAKGKVFRPVEGATGDRATNIFVLPTPRGYYAALFNFDDKQKHTIVLDLNRLRHGFAASSAHVLDSGREVSIEGNKLQVNLSPAESQLVEITGVSANPQTATKK